MRLSPAVPRAALARVQGSGRREQPGAEPANPGEQRKSMPVDVANLRRNTPNSVRLGGEAALYVPSNKGPLGSVRSSMGELRLMMEGTIDPGLLWYSYSSAKGVCYRSYSPERLYDL